MLVAGFAQMHLTVDDAGEHMKPFGVDHFACTRLTEIADGGDAARDDTDVGDADAILIDDGAAFDNEVISRAHADTFSVRGAGSGARRASSALAAS